MYGDAVVDKGTNGSGLISKLRYRIMHSSKLFYFLITILIIYGWANKELSNLTAESGTGYWLGIIGGVLMLLLLFYPLRKKLRFLSQVGNIKYWFKIHMIFGVVGPVAILFHSNFSLGSANSNVAMFSMIIVAVSGLIGRYFYAKIHHGLYGRKASLKEYRASLKESKSYIGKQRILSKETEYNIKKAERYLLRDRSVLMATILWPLIFLRTLLSKRSIRKSLKKSYLKAAREREEWNREMARSFFTNSNEEVQSYISGLYEMYGFRIFENLFSLWHLLHYPLFIMLVFTGIVHVIVVHIY